MYILNIQMDDAPHLDKSKIDAWLEQQPLNQREARRYGLPRMGSGLVYPILVDKLIIEPFEIPKHWKVAVGLDYGRSAEHKTACVWIAQDPNTGVHYLYDEYLAGYEKPFVHAHAILSRGINPFGVKDYSINETSKGQDADSYQLEQAGLTRLYNADKSIFPGITKLWELMTTGKFKVFRHCQNFCNEFGMYSYGKNGKPDKKAGKDDLMDATRYIILKFDEVAQPLYKCKLNYNIDDEYDEFERYFQTSTDTIGGY